MKRKIRIRNFLKNELAFFLLKRDLINFIKVSSGNGASNHGLPGLRTRVDVPWQLRYKSQVM